MPAESARSLLEALRGANPPTVERAARALRRLPPSRDAREIATVVQCLHQFCSSARDPEVRQELTALLRLWTEQAFTVSEVGMGDDEVRTRYQPWFDWFAANYPDQAASHVGWGGQIEWKHRLSLVGWSRGNPSLGRDVFQRRQRASCHAAHERLGPELKTVARQLSRDDLFAAIVDPSRSVSPAYRSRRVVSRSGRVYHGMVVYESPSATLLQTGPGNVVRFAEQDAVEFADRPQSLMPTGLLDKASVERMLLKFLPNITIGVAHGQMDGTQLENVMLDFIDGVYDVLLATTIIESGLDIPNANTRQ